MSEVDWERIEKRAGGAKRAAALLGVPYQGSYCAWKSGRRATPDYIRFSVEAHLRLSDRALKDLERGR